jgi:uncharacterized low-complexity protein
MEAFQMSQQVIKKPLAIALGAVFVTSLAGIPVANAAENPFAMSDLTSGYVVAEMEEGKCGEGKCGGDKTKKEGKCGEGKCGGDKAKAEGKCGGDKAETMATEGADKAKKEGKCGEGKCGGSK